MCRIIIFVFASALGLASASAQSDPKILADVQKALHAYSLDSIHASVQNGFVTLTGDVNLCQARVLADRTLSGIPGVIAILDRVQVTGPTFPDRQLKFQVSHIIANRSRKLGGWQYGSISAHVQDGVVTLTGRAAPQLAYPAVELVAGVPGVKNVVDHVRRITPISPDWPVWDMP